VAISKNVKGSMSDFGLGRDSPKSLSLNKFTNQSNPVIPTIPNKQNAVISKGTCPKSLHNSAYFSCSMMCIFKKGKKDNPNKYPLKSSTRIVINPAVI
jgi:hypothetical protein